MWKGLRASLQGQEERTRKMYSEEDTWEDTNFYLKYEKS